MSLSAGDISALGDAVGASSGEIDAAIGAFASDTASVPSESADLAIPPELEGWAQQHGVAIPAPPPINSITTTGSFIDLLGQAEAQAGPLANPDAVMQAAVDAAKAMSIEVPANTSIFAGAHGPQTADGKTADEEDAQKTQEPEEVARDTAVQFGPEPLRGEVENQTLRGGPYNDLVQDIGSGAIGREIGVVNSALANGLAAVSQALSGWGYAAASIAKGAADSIGKSVSIYGEAAYIQGKGVIEVGGKVSKGIHSLNPLSPISIPYDQFESIVTAFGRNPQDFIGDSKVTLEEGIALYTAVVGHFDRSALNIVLEAIVNNDFMLNDDGTVSPVQQTIAAFSRSMDDKAQDYGNTGKVIDAAEKTQKAMGISEIKTPGFDRARGFNQNFGNIMGPVLTNPNQQ